MPMKDNILVLCHSNMHRSPFVAEFIRNSPYGDSYEVRDAGLHVDKEQRVPKSLQRAFQTVSISCGSGIPESGTNTCSRSWTTRNSSF